MCKVVKPNIEYRTSNSMFGIFSERVLRGKRSSVAPPRGTWIKDIAQIVPRREKSLSPDRTQTHGLLSRGMCSTAVVHHCPSVPLMLLWIELPDHWASAVANIIDVLFPVDLRLISIPSFIWSSVVCFTSKTIWSHIKRGWRQHKTWFN